MLEPDTGVLLHNRGACFSADPDSPNALGPGKRPLHTLMPVVLTRGGRVSWVAGTMGGHAHAIAVRPDGSFDAASDPRADGGAATGP